MSIYIPFDTLPDNREKLFICLQDDYRVKFAPRYYYFKIGDKQSRQIICSIDELCATETVTAAVKEKLLHCKPGTTVRVGAAGRGSSYYMRRLSDEQIEELVRACDKLAVVRKKRDEVREKIDALIGPLKQTLSELNVLEEEVQFDIDDVQKKLWGDPNPPRRRPKRRTAPNWNLINK
jgi:hypothetical protein